jgi:hypothetical protein
MNNKIEFEYKGVWITNPHYDETGKFPVNASEYYGEAYDHAIDLSMRWSF